jgi:hypothetical protein
MSDLRIALVAEGPTDHVIIEAALRAILPRPFVLTLLQPEATRPKLGSGWCGVLKWCGEFQARGYGSIEDDPTLELYSLVILHLDADVADKSYEDCSMTALARWGSLPCSQACPPPAATADQLSAVLLSWLGISAAGNKTTLCVQSKSSEAWLAAAVFPENQTLMKDIECRINIECQLSQLPKNQRIKKGRTEYLRYTSVITAS